MSGLIGEQSISNGFNIIRVASNEATDGALYLIKISLRYPRIFYLRNLPSLPSFLSCASSKSPKSHGKSSHRNNEIRPFRANFEQIFSSLLVALSLSLSIYVSIYLSLAFSLFCSFTLPFSSLLRSMTVKRTPRKLAVERKRTALNRP